MVRTRMALGRLFAVACLAAVLCLASMAGALADVATMASAAGSVVDFSPFAAEAVNIAIIVVAPAVGTLALAIVLRIYRLAGVKVSASKEQAIRDSVDQALFHAAAFGRANTGAIGPIRVDLGHPAVALGASYAMEAIPKALKDLGITDAASERLQRMVAARLNHPELTSAA